jgi:hypothetical protein
MAPLPIGSGAIADRDAVGAHDPQVDRRDWESTRIGEGAEHLLCRE